MTVEEFEKATEQELRQKANQLFEQSERVKVNAEYRTALLTEAHFYLDEIERRDDSFRSTRDLVLELVVIGLIAIEIVFSVVAYYDGKAQFSVLSSLQASSSATAAALTNLQQVTQQMNKAVQEQLIQSYEVALKLELNGPDNQLEITNEGRTPATLWGVKVADQLPTMQTRPSVLTPGTSHDLPAERIFAIAQDQLNKNKPPAVSIPLLLFLRNEKGEEFVGHYLIVNGFSYGPFRPHIQVISVKRASWSKGR